MSFPLTPEHYDKPLHACIVILFRSHYFHFDFSFLVFLPIIIDLVFAISYHATLEYDFWYCDCFYPFCLLIYVTRVKKALYKSPSAINIQSR